MMQWRAWRKLIALLAVCWPVAWGEQILPQLIVQIASLDHDHGISLRAHGGEIDLIFAHDRHSLPKNGESGALALSASEKPHVVHLMAGPASAKPLASLTVSNSSKVAAYFSASIITEWRTFVPPMPLAYSRPPPGELALLPNFGSTLLLI